MLTFHRFGLPRRVLLLDDAAIPGGAVVVPHSVFRLGRLEVSSNSQGEDNKRPFILVWQSETTSTDLLRYADENAAIAAAREIATALKPRRNTRTTPAILSAMGLAILIAVGGLVGLRDKPIRWEWLASLAVDTTSADRTAADSATITDSQPPPPPMEGAQPQDGLNVHPKQALVTTTNRAITGFVALPE